MFVLKNILVLFFGLIQTILGGLWFAAFLLDTFGLNTLLNIHFSVHILFAILFIIGCGNIYLALINFSGILLNTRRKYDSSFSISLLSVILSVILFLIIKFAFTLK